MIGNSITHSNQISAEIARLAQESYELDKEKEMGQQQSQRLTYHMISEIAGTNMRLEMLKMQLTSSNELLEKEIVQLKKQHEKEVDSLLDSVKLEISLVAVKLQAIVEQFNSYMTSDFAKANTISLPDVDLLKTLVIDIAKCHKKVITTYPQYCDLREKPLTSYQKQMVIFPVTADLTLAKTDLVLKAFIEDSHQIYEALKMDVTPVENTCQSLIAEKEMMIDFHKKYLEKFKIEELALPLKEIYGLISSAYKQIEWSKLFTLKPGLYASYGCLESSDIAFYSKVHQEGLDKEANKMKDKMELIVSNLFSIVNPQVSKAEIAS